MALQYGGGDPKFCERNHRAQPGRREHDFDFPQHGRHRRAAGGLGQRQLLGGEHYRRVAAQGRANRRLGPERGRAAIYQQWDR